VLIYVPAELEVYLITLRFVIGERVGVRVNFLLFLYRNVGPNYL